MAKKKKAVEKLEGDLWEVYIGDVLEVLKSLPDSFVHEIITSPPYYSLRDNQVTGQIGLEKTPQEYIDKLVLIFREARRVLREDGTCWLVIGDSYSGSGKARGGGGKGLTSKKQTTNRGAYFDNLTSSGIGSNVFDCLERGVESQPLVFGDAATIGITAKSRDISLHDDGFPYGKLLSLLGIERITIKQRDNNFCQILHTFASPSYCWIDCPIRFVSRNMSDLEIVLDAGYSPGIIVTNHDANAKTVLGVKWIISRRSSKAKNAALTIKEASEPITEWIISGQSYGNAIPFDTPFERFPDVYFVDQPVALRNRLDTSASGLCNFRVAQASIEQITFSLADFGVDLTFAGITHLFIPNSFGSLISYLEIYDKANRKANAAQAKQELGIPDLVKRALMEEGWICRSTIIWSKSNPMPESVSDRPTRSHEMVYLLTKANNYFYDQEAIKEPSVDPESHTGVRRRKAGAMYDLDRIHYAAAGSVEEDGYKRSGQVYPTRNKRTVWTVPTNPYRGAHFSTFPLDLVDPMILAGTSARGCCPKCGAGWARVVERTRLTRPELPKDDPRYRPNSYCGSYGDINGRSDAGYTDVITKGWQPGCSCYGVERIQRFTGSRKQLKLLEQYRSLKTNKCIILDPFVGCGTTLGAAVRRGRKAIGIELNPRYVEGLVARRVEELRRVPIKRKKGK